MDLEKEHGTIRKRLKFGSMDSDENKFQRESILSANQPVLTYLRVKPIPEDDKERCMKIMSDNVLIVQPSKDSVTYKNNKRGTCEFPQQFLFSHIFGQEASQKNVFDELSPDLIQDFFAGHDCLLFSYGVTNSGKTHTILGTLTDPGILPRSLGVIFNTIDDKLYQGQLLKPKNYSEVRFLSKEEQMVEIEFKESLMKKATVVSDNVSIMSEGNSAAALTLSESQLPGTTMEQSLASSINITELLNESKAFLDEEAEDRRFSIWVSCAEIYNEFIYDLLDYSALESQSKAKDKKKKLKRTVLKLAYDRNKNCYVKGLKEVKVDSIEEVVLLCKFAQCNRKMAATMLNYSSSRSHCVFTIKLVQTSNLTKPSFARINRMSIVDLAGSERTAKTQAVGTRAKEAGNINVSLMVLGRCIDTIRFNQKKRKGDLRIVPFRESKLTQLFQNFFVGKGHCAGQGRVILLVNVSPAPSVFDETLQVLKFSALANQVCPYPCTMHDQPLEETLIQNASQCEDGDSEESRKDSLVGSASRQQQLQERKLSLKQWDGSGPTQKETDQWTHEQTYENYIELYKYCEEVEKHYNEALEENDKLFEETKKLKLENFEQAANLRQSLWKEFSERFSVIQEEHRQTMMEREELMENMYEKKIEILERNVLETQIYTRRKRKREKEEEEEEHLKQLSLLRDEIKQLKYELAKKDREFTEKMLSITGRQEEDLVSCNQKVNMMSLELMEANKKHQDAMKHSKSLEEQCKRLKEENQELTQKKSAIQSELEQFKAEMASREVQSIKQENVAAENNEEGMESHSSQLVDDHQLQELKEQLTEITEKLKQKKKENDQLQNELTEIKDSLEASNNYRAMLLEQNVQHKQELTMLKSISGESEDTIDDLQLQLSLAKAELEKSNRKREALDNKVDTLTNSLEDEKRSHEVALKVAMEKADICQAGIEAQLADQKKHCATLELQLSQEQAEVKSLQVRVEKLALKEANLKAEVKELTSKLKTITTKHNKEINCINGSHQLEIGQLNSKIRSLLEELSLKNKEMDTHMESYEQEVAIIEEKHKEEVKSLQEKNTTMQRSNSQLSLSEHSLNKDLSEVNKKLNKLKKDNEKLEASHTELKAEFDKAKKTWSSEKLRYEKDIQSLREQHQLESQQCQKSHAPARKRRKTTTTESCTNSSSDSSDRLLVVPWSTLDQTAASKPPVVESSDVMDTGHSISSSVDTESSSDDNVNRRRTRNITRKSRAVSKRSTAMDQTMPYVPNLETSSQILEDTTLLSYQQQQQEDRIVIDATPASAVKQRRNRRKKKLSQAYTLDFSPETQSKIPRRSRKTVVDENEDPSVKKTGTLKRIGKAFSQSKNTLTRSVKKAAKDSDSNSLYDDVTPTPKKVAKTRKVVRKSQISAPILHNSSVILALSPGKSAKVPQGRWKLRSRTLK